MLKIIRIFIIVILLNLLFSSTIFAMFSPNDVSIRQNINEDKMSNYTNIGKEVVEQTKHFGNLFAIIFAIIIVLVIIVLTIYITKKNNKFKYFLVKNKMIIIIASIILVCAIAIAFGVYAQVTNRSEIKSKEKEQNTNYTELEDNFDEIFTNNINKEKGAKDDINYDEIIYCAYDIQSAEGSYDINAKIPLFKIENEVTKKVNQEIYDTFAKTIIDIVQNSTVHTTFNLDYVAYVNNNILSLVIRCTYKNGSNPQRKIIQTYNYNIDNNKLVDINEVISHKNLNKEDVEKKVREKIKAENAEVKTFAEQGYNVFVRNESDDMYKIEKTPNFFLGKDNYLYLVYAYGNNNYTSELDLVIF